MLPDVQEVVLAWGCNTTAHFSFSRRSRLTRRDGFASLLKQRAQSNQWFVVYSQPNRFGCARLGLTVGKRFVPKAVQRNKIKRMIRECFRSISRDGVERDVVIRLRTRLEKKDQANARLALVEVLLGILSKNEALTISHPKVL